MRAVVIRSAGSEIASTAGSGSLALAPVGLVRSCGGWGRLLLAGRLWSRSAGQQRSAARCPCSWASAAAPACRGLSSASAALAFCPVHCGSSAWCVALCCLRLCPAAVASSCAGTSSASASCRCECASSHSGVGGGRGGGAVAAEAAGCVRACALPSAASLCKNSRTALPCPVPAGP
jgi:hypothetical protein